MTKTRILGLSLAALVAVGLVATPATADAQVRRRGNGNAYGQKNRRQWVVRPLVVRTERESNAFRNWFERSQDRRDSGLKTNVQRLDEALERLRSKATDNRPGVGRDELQDALRYARLVNARIYRADARRTVREWSDLHRTLNELARLYGLKRV